jgi:DNA-binding NarL/FixJ family response regulator
LDLNLPGLNGEVSCGLLKKQFPECKIIAFTDHLIDVEELINLNFDGRYMKGQDTAILIEAIQTVLRGEKYFNSTSKQLKGTPNPDTKIHPYLLSKNITNRELEIIMLYLQDMSNKEIADKLFISETTVNTHKRNFKYKIGKNKKKDVKEFLDSIGLSY